MSLTPERRGITIIRAGQGQMGTSSALRVIQVIGQIDTMAALRVTQVIGQTDSMSALRATEVIGQTHKSINLMTFLSITRVNRIMVEMVILSMRGTLDQEEETIDICTIRRM
ncbi:hypothetical protein KP79_PYT02211 [Mizuhopecten yessoensis]|uniref:Uncharacterized protein n=1 Tax=Mizuhopecten yessoensis TaxID=6573 RepID=A0A210PXP6_MIZYE|nr:hypothetical protein KP79_PYT02211 [Mizuhopecten yessoensis]